MACSFRPIRSCHSPICHGRACPRSLPEGTAQTPCWHRGLRSPQSPFSACSTWKTSDSRWPDDSSLPSTSQTAICWHWTLGWGRPQTAARPTSKGAAEHPAEHRPIHPKPNAATLLSGTGAGWAPGRSPAGASPNRRYGPGWLTEGPTRHTSKGEAQGPAKRVPSRGCLVVSSPGSPQG